MLLGCCLSLMKVAQARQDADTSLDDAAPHASIGVQGNDGMAA